MQKGKFRTELPPLECARNILASGGLCRFHNIERWTVGRWLQRGRWFFHTTSASVERRVRTGSDPIGREAGSCRLRGAGQAF